MFDVKKIAARTAIAGALGVAALGIGSGVANAAPSPVATHSSWAENPGWGHGPGPWGGDDRDRDWNRGPGWGPPPPPAYNYGGYGGGYGGGGGCVTGPLGLLHFGNC